MENSSQVSEEFARTVRHAVYHHFVTSGRAPSVEELSRAMGVFPSEVELAFRRLAEERALVLHPRTTGIWMAMPFSAVPTEFCVETDNGSWSANCGWDALGIPVVLGADVRISTRCPDCGESIVFSVRDGRCLADDLLIHFGVPAARWWDDIGFT